MPTCDVTELALELTEACNYRCVMCDYWKLKAPKFLSLDDARDFLGLFEPNKIHSVLFTGGEPLLNKQWRNIAAAIPKGTKKYLCTNGSPLKKKNLDVGDHFDRITVSVDGATEKTFQKIRGRRDLKKILVAIEQIKKASPAVRIYLKMTIQKGNYFEVADLFRLSVSTGCIDGIRYGIPDMSSLAFAHKETNNSTAQYSSEVNLQAAEIVEFERIVNEVHEDFSQEIAAGYMVEGDLFRYLARFKALLRMQPDPPVRDCEIPYRTMFLKANGQIGACYFLGTVTSLKQLKQSGAWNTYKDSIRRHSPYTNKTCQTCDQCMIPSSAPAIDAHRGDLAQVAAD